MSNFKFVYQDKYELKHCNINENTIKIFGITKSKSLNKTVVNITFDDTNGNTQQSILDIRDNYMSSIIIDYIYDKIPGL